MLFDKFENKTVYTGTIVAIDPIHIGSSGAEELDPTQFDNMVIKDAEGRPFIPGSSLKGVVRSSFEAVMKSVGASVCDVLDNKADNCFRGTLKSGAAAAEEMYKKSCDVCRLFGGRGIASKLRFKDCVFIGEKCLFEHRDGVGIDRETGAAKRGAKYDYEIVPKGSRFEFYMTAENIDEEQKKYVEYIIRLLESGELSVGGKTTRGLGRIRLEGLKKKETTLDSLRAELGIAR